MVSWLTAHALRAHAGRRRFRPAPVLLLAAALGLAGCGLFTPREPEPPTEGGSPYTSPTDPQIVVDNLRAAVTNLNTQTYRRSLASSFSFTPASDAASEPIWTGWGPSEEQSYFNTLAAAAQSTVQPELTFTDATLTLVREELYAYEASYTLSVQHSRSNAPTTVQGRLRWEIGLNAEDDLWYLEQWIDHGTADAASWSDLKAAFFE